MARVPQGKLRDDVKPIANTVQGRYVTLAFDNITPWIPELEEKLYASDTETNRIYIKLTVQMLRSASQASKENPDLFYHRSKEFLTSVEAETRKNELPMSLEAFYIATFGKEEAPVAISQAALFTVLTSFFVLYNSYTEYGNIDSKCYKIKDGTTQSAKTLAKKTFTTSFCDFESSSSKAKSRSKIEPDDSE